MWVRKRSRGRRLSHGVMSALNSPRTAPACAGNLNGIEGGQLSGEGPCLCNGRIQNVRPSARSKDEARSSLPDLAPNEAGIPPARMLASASCACRVACLGNRRTRTGRGQRGGLREIQKKSHAHLTQIPRTSHAHPAYIPTQIRTHPGTSQLYVRRSPLHRA